MESEQLWLLIGVLDHASRRQNFIMAKVMKKAIIVNKCRQELLTARRCSHSDLHTRLANTFTYSLCTSNEGIHDLLAEQPGYHNGYLHTIHWLWEADIV